MDRILCCVTDSMLWWECFLCCRIIAFVKNFQLYENNLFSFHYYFILPTFCVIIYLLCELFGKVYPHCFVKLTHPVEWSLLILLCEVYSPCWVKFTNPVVWSLLTLLCEVYSPCCVKFTHPVVRRIPFCVTIPREWGTEKEINLIFPWLLHFHQAYIFPWFPLLEAVTALPFL